MPPSSGELEDAEDVGFYFKFYGGIDFCGPDAAPASDAPGATGLVAASSKHGLVFFSDLQGVRAAKAWCLSCGSLDRAAQCCRWAY